MDIFGGLDRWLRWRASADHWSDIRGLDNGRVDWADKGRTLDDPRRNAKRYSCYRLHSGRQVGSGIEVERTELGDLKMRPGKLGPAGSSKWVDGFRVDMMSLFMNESYEKGPRNSSLTYKYDNHNVLDNIW